MHPNYRITWGPNVLRPQQGFNMVELMITMTIYTALFAGVISLVTQLLTSQRYISADLELENELNLIGEILLSEIRRAGYDENAAELFLSEQTSPFSSPISLYDTENQNVYDCILFSYDRNRNGKLDTETPDERFGFKLHDKAIEIRRSGASCEQGGWHDLTDPRTVTVTRFSIKPYSSLNGLHFLHIAMSAHHTRFTHLKRDKHRFVKIENAVF